MEYRVLVLMSTYNGEYYLKEQIDSILSQEGVKLHILIRDDGSIDNTCSILEEYGRKNSNIHWYKADNIGFVSSFSELMLKARERGGYFDYFAFSDQDDIWMPDKLLRSCEKLALMDNNKPSLYTSNSILINSKGQTLALFHSSFPRYRRGNVLIYGTEQGCSMTFNRRALDLYCSYPPSRSYHDRWMYMICSFLGSAYYDHEPRFYYRIHDNNAVGKISERANKNILMRFFSKSMFKPLNNHLEMAWEFYNSFCELLSPSARNLFVVYCSYRRNPFYKVKMLVNKEYMCPYSETRTKIYYFVCTLFNKV